MNKEVQENEKATIEGSSLVATTVSSSNFIPNQVYENLPEPLNEIVNEFQGREKDIIFLSLLGVLSACLPNVKGNYDGRFFGTNLYVFIIAPPASGKGVMDWSKLLIQPIHESKKAEYQRKLQEFRRSQEENVSKPELIAKVIPGNVSSSKCYHHLEYAEDSLLMFETEADSLSNMLKQDWGDFSDLMRKAFQHETCSISRSDRLFEVDNPKLSIVLSGTPNQIQPLISSKENGLFSRFLFYYFDEVQGWKDVFAKSHTTIKEELFKEKGNETKELYDRLIKTESIEVVMNEEQCELFNEIMSDITNLFLENKNDFISVTKRLGLICFRIVMILTILRNQEQIQEESLVIEATDEDVITSLEFIKHLVDHSLHVFDMYEKNTVKMTVIERQLYTNLSETFTRKKGLEIATVLNIAQRTYGAILKKWVNDKILSKIKHGVYKKLPI